VYLLTFVPNSMSWTLTRRQKPLFPSSHLLKIPTKHLGQMMHLLHLFTVRLPWMTILPVPRPPFALFLYILLWPLLSPLRPLFNPPAAYSGLTVNVIKPSRDGLLTSNAVPSPIEYLCSDCNSSFTGKLDLKLHSKYSAISVE
jgi:hypothetical protein